MTVRTRNQRLTAFAPILLAAIGAAGLCGSVRAADGGEKIDPKKNRVTPQWEIHDMKRPTPAIITPGKPASGDEPATPPSDAMVLFDGKDLSHWTSGGKEAPWKVENGYMEAAKAGIETKEPLGDMQLHLEFACPSKVEGSSQGRGNSGVIIMGRYELQVLDSFDNVTYADGQASAMYGQNPPLVNAARRPGEWQTYDVIWHGPRFDEAGKVTRPAVITVLHNGVLTQDHYTLVGGTGHHVQPAYAKHGEKEPLQLQFHGNTTRFRNIWVRPLGDEGIKNDAAPGAGDAKPAAASVGGEKKGE